MSKTATILLTAMVPCIWGSTFVVTTELLPPDLALTNAFLRALPAGVLLLIITRELPRVEWLGKLFIAGALNFMIFWWLLFEAAYRLPGGVAATVGAIQPLIVYVLSGFLLGIRLSWPVYAAGVSGVLGVALLALTPEARVDLTGVAAAIGGALSMALGVVLTKKWQLPASPLSFAAWQLIAGGLLLFPVALAYDAPIAAMTAENLIGYFYLSVIGGALTYAIWFWGISKLGPATPTTLGFFSPLSAMILGWIILDQTLSGLQLVGAVTILGSVVAGVYFQGAITPPRSGPERRKAARGDAACEELTHQQGLARQWLLDPLSHPSIQKMSIREMADLPIDPPRIRPE